MKCRQFTLASNRGYTLVELLVASTIGLLVLSMVLKDTISNRSLFRQDLVRTRLSQDLRSALDILAVNAREAGENLPGSFPAVEIIDGGSAPDQIVLRRNLHDEILSLCQPISSGQLYFADSGTTPGCIYSDNLFNYSQWSAERAAAGGSLRIYLFDQVSHDGEFIDYTGESDTGSELYLEIGSAPYHTYTPGSTAVYILEEWRFSVSGDLLQLQENADSSTIKDVVYGITDLQIEAELKDGTVVQSFSPSDHWTELKALRVALSAQDHFGGKTMDRTLSAEFFPRNVLSN